MQNVCYNNSKSSQKLLWYMIRIFSSSYESAGWASCFFMSFLPCFLNKTSLYYLIMNIMSYKFIYFYNLNKRSPIIDYRAYNYTEPPTTNFPST